MSGRQIIFVERASDAVAAARLSGQSGDSTIIALNSSVMWELEKQNAPYRIGLDFYPRGELFDLKGDLYDRVEKVCVRLDEILVEQVSGFRDSQDEPLHLARAVFHSLNSLLNTLAQNLLNILRPCQALKPQRIGVYAPPPDRPHENLKLDPDRINLFFKLLQAVAEDQGIDLDVFDAFPRRGLWRKRIQNVRLFTARLITKGPAKLRDAFRRTPVASQHLVAALDGTRSSAMRVFVPKQRYSAGMLARSLAGQDIATVIGPLPVTAASQQEDQQLRRQFEKAWQVIRDDPRIAELFTFEEIGMLGLVDEYLRTLLRIGLIDAMRIYRQTRRMLARNPVDIMLLTTVVHPDGFGMALACRDEGIPVVTWQHGNYAMFEPHPQPAYYDIREADHFFAFGEGIKRAYTEYGRKWNTQIVPVGSAPLDRIVGEAARASRRTPRGRPTVLAPLRGLNIPIIGDSYQSYPLDLYWRELQKMLVAFAKFSQLQFLLKLYPANTPLDNPIRDFLKTRGLKNIRMQYLRGFTTLLPTVDLVVLDWPYTTLLESISTPVPVICYRKYWPPLRNGVEEMIRKRCFLADSPEQLDDYLRQYTDGRLPVLDDRTLLREYGTNEDDGKSLTRGLLALQRICGQKKTD